MSADERAELVARWRARARMLDQQADSYERMGDSEYAAGLREAAADNRTAADRLEHGAPS